jgi:HEAT repeat protein
MFIEGATKDRNGAIRAECATGLGLIGPATFRTLLLVLHDGDHQVRDSASAAIVKNMTPESVNHVFCEPSVAYQRHSIICSVRELQNLDQ